MLKINFAESTVQFIPNRDPSPPPSDATLPISGMTSLNTEKKRGSEEAAPPPKKVHIDFNGRLEAFNDPTYHFTLTEGPYESTAFSEQFFSQFHPVTPQAAYTYLQAFEVNGTENPLLKLRITHDGKIGELMWVQKGVKVTGTQVMQLYRQLADAFKIENIYLYDDAKIEFTTDRQRSFNMYRFYPLVSQSGQPFYEDKLGFTAVNALAIKELLPEEKPLDQEREKFDWAVKHLREMKLTTFCSISIYPGQKAIITKLFAKCFPRQELKKTQITLHDFVLKAYENSKKGSYDDLCELCERCFKFYTPYKAPKEGSPEALYVEALKYYTRLSVFRQTQCTSNCSL